jgi:protein-tyrosine phosphatase
VVRHGLVDIHSHVCPSGDDGAQSLDEGVALCLDAAAHGTAVLFATPHVWPEPGLTDQRERQILLAFSQLKPRAGLELRLGYELTPSRWLLREDLRRFVLGGTGALLVEVPFVGPAGLLLEVLDRADEQGLRVVVAHPERAQATQDDPALLDELAARTPLLQVNSTSLLGRHGDTAAGLGWELVESGRAAIVASDGHRTTRPARLDDALELAETRLGPDAIALFDGSALGVTTQAQASVSFDTLR